MFLVIVTPGEVSALIFRFQFAEFGMGAMCFPNPAIVIDAFVVIPHMVVGAIRVVHAITNTRAASGGR
jgi:hypothetical protein